MNTIRHMSEFLKARRGASTTEYAVIMFAVVLILIGLSAFTGLGFMVAVWIRGLVVGA